MDAGRSRSEKHFGDVTWTGTTERTKAESRLGTINRFREIGWQFIRQQQEYLASIQDPAARNEADIVLTTGNQLMLAFFTRGWNRNSPDAKRPVA